MRNAAVLQRRDLLLVHPYGMVDSGYLVVIEPVQVIRSDSSRDLLGGAVRKVLGAYCSGMADPDPAISLDRSLIEAAGVASRSALMQGARHVSIIEKEGDILFRPSENMGARKGFRHRPDLDVRVSADSEDADLGAAVVRALELSK